MYSIQLMCEISSNSHLRYPLKMILSHQRQVRYFTWIPPLSSFRLVVVCSRINLCYLAWGSLDMLFSSPGLHLAWHNTAHPLGSLDLRSFLRSSGPNWIVFQSDCSFSTLTRHLTIPIFFLFKFTTPIRLDGPWEWGWYFTFLSSSMYTVSDTQLALKFE